MLERLNISLLYRIAQVAFVFMLVLIPFSAVNAQDDVDDVEEYWGDDEEYEDDEYEYEDDEYLDDEYEDDEYEDEEYEDEEYEDEDEDEPIRKKKRSSSPSRNSGRSRTSQNLSDDADNLGYTIDIALGSPRFTNINLMQWSSGIDMRGSVEFPVLMQIGSARFRFGGEIGTFNYKHAVPPATDTYSGISAMGIMAFPAGPGKIKVGGGVVGSSPGFIFEASYGIRVGGIMDIRAGVRSTEVMDGTTEAGANIGRTGWMDGQIVLGINL
tara:strand:- start:131 stop:937 length:807 start_codon:yes stop_codon:yes gene_type:complete